MLVQYRRESAEMKRAIAGLYLRVILSQQRLAHAQPRLDTQRRRTRPTRRRQDALGVTLREVRWQFVCRKPR